MCNTLGTVQYIATIIVTMYNDEQYIEACITSIICQISDEYEVLLVDDASTDNTVEICEKYATSNIKIIRLSHNSGLSVARQIGIENASGKYISFMDADDLISDNYFSSFIKEMETDNLDVCVCGTQYLNGNYSVLSSTCGDRYKDTIKISKEQVEQDYINLTSIYHLSDSWDKMYNREFIQNSGLRFCMPKGLNGSDALFNRMMILHLPRIKIIPDVLYIHIARQNSMVTRKDKDLLKMNTEIYSRMTIKANDLKYEKVYESFKVEFYYRLRSELSQKLDTLSMSEYQEIQDDRVTRVYLYIKKHPELKRMRFNFLYFDLFIFYLLQYYKFGITLYICVFNWLKKLKLKILKHEICS